MPKINIRAGKCAECNQQKQPLIEFVEDTVVDRAKPGDVVRDEDYQQIMVAVCLDCVREALGAAEQLVNRMGRVPAPDDGLATRAGKP